MASFALLVLIAFVVGALIGAVGVGGILLIPALEVLASLGIHQAMATALFTFIFTGVAGTVLFERKGSIDWRMTVPVCWGALVFAFGGAWLNSLARPQALLFLLAGLIIFAGAYTLVTLRTAPRLMGSVPSAPRTMLLAAVGATTGLGSGLTGVGGPALSVPLMVVLGFPALASIGTGQVIQIIAALSGTLGNLSFGSIDFRLALPVTLAEIIGVLVGVRWAHTVNHLALRRFVGLLCMAVGLFVLARALS